MLKLSFQDQIKEGIPKNLPEPKPYDLVINHAPKRKAILTLEEQKLALKNALRYFDIPTEFDEWRFLPELCYGEWCKLIEPWKHVIDADDNNGLRVVDQ